ncbi:methyltransferase protein [Acetobacter sp. CAG:977]|nr:methyltransferase protein [Acetobacter sp. CAG:977]
MNLIESWSKLKSEEDVMNDHHAPFWRSMIQQMSEKDLHTASVLDFGCNQGGFLRTLYRIKPFRRGLGVDLAIRSLEIADGLKGDMPLQYTTPEILADMEENIDIAFSHDVIYLLDDLKEHARTIKKVLKANGVYYAATGCYSEMPLWPLWKKEVEAYSNIPLSDYSINDFAESFWAEGFDVAIQKCIPEGFVTCWQGREAYFPKITDFLKYYDYKIIFRFSKKEEIKK